MNTPQSITIPTYTPYSFSVHNALNNTTLLGDMKAFRAFETVYQNSSKFRLIAITLDFQWNKAAAASVNIDWAFDLEMCQNNGFAPRDAGFTVCSMDDSIGVSAGNVSRLSNGWKSHGIIIVPPNWYFRLHEFGVGNYSWKGLYQWYEYDLG